MAYKLPFGNKLQVDKLGPGYVEVESRIMDGTPVFEHSGRLAKRKFLEAGLGFPHLTHDDCEIRVWPGQDRIMIAWGCIAADGKPWDIAHVYKFDKGIRDQLIERGVMPRVS